eukprot:1935846-Prymnesium_polylepis.1
MCVCGGGVGRGASHRRLEARDAGVEHVDVPAGIEPPEAGDTHGLEVRQLVDVVPEREDVLWHHTIRQVGQRRVGTEASGAVELGVEARAEEVGREAPGRRAQRI